MQRIDKILSNMGIGSRKEVKTLIKSGAIKIDGICATDVGQKTDPAVNCITINGQELQYKKYIYLMLNKPAGFVSATEDAKFRTVAELVPLELMHYQPFPVGRLDIDTEGLLVMTNDGHTAHQLLSPKHKVPKRYFAKINKLLEPSDFTAFEQGITLDDGYVTLPGHLEGGQAGEAYVTIYEGKFHQVKRMFEALDKQVIYLKRLQMGGLKLDETLALGECRELTEEELTMLLGNH